MRTELQTDGDAADNRPGSRPGSSAPAWNRLRTDWLRERLRLSMEDQSRIDTIIQESIQQNVPLNDADDYWCWLLKEGQGPPRGREDDPCDHCGRGGARLQPQGSRATGCSKRG